MAPFWHQRKSFWLNMAYRHLIGAVPWRAEIATRGATRLPAATWSLRAPVRPEFIGFMPRVLLRDYDIVGWDPCGLVAAAFSQMVSTRAVTTL
jgi:hypothetical protein